MRLSNDDSIGSRGNEESGGAFSIIGDLFRYIPIKLSVLVFIIYLILSSDVFAQNVLTHYEGAVDYANMPTNKGTVIIGLFLVLAIIFIDVAIKAEII